MKPKKNSLLLKLDALVMRVRPANDGASRVTVFDSRLGKTELIAFGARREKSSRRSALIVGNWITGEAEETEEPCAVLTECRLFRSFPDLMKDLKRSASLFLLFEVMDLLFPSKLPSDDFPLVEETLERLNLSPDGSKYVLSTLLTLLDHEGVFPDLEILQDRNGRISLGKEEFMFGAGSVRFLQDNRSQRGRLSFWADKKLDHTVEQNLRNLIAAVCRHLTGKSLSSLSLFI